MFGAAASYNAKFPLARCGFYLFADLGDFPRDV